jgi:LAO/AO transport system kinase
LLCSAVENTGVSELMRALETMAERLKSAGHTATRRHEQDRWWMRATVEERLIGDFFSDPRVQAALLDLEKAVISGARSPFDAADELLRSRS